MTGGSFRWPGEELGQGVWAQDVHDGLPPPSQPAVLPTEALVGLLLHPAAMEAPHLTSGRASVQAHITDVHRHQEPAG